MLINVGEPLLLFVILVNKLKLKAHCLIPAILGIVAIGAVTTVMNNAGCGYVETFIVALALHEAYSFLLFRGSFRHKMIWGASFIFILVISNTIAYISFELFGSSENMLSPTWDRVIMLSVYYLLDIALTVAVLKFNGKDRVLPLYISFIVVLLCIVGGTTLYMLLGEIADLAGNGMSAIRCIIPAFATLLFMFAVLVLLDMISKSIKKQLDAQAELTVYNSKKEHEQNMLAMAERFRRIQHDYANHMTTITGFVNKRDMDGLAAYMDDYNAQYNVGTYYITGYTVIDSILTSKALRCERDGIEFNADIKISGNVPLSELEQTMVFGNLLDNAIEAQSSVTTKKYITLTCETVKGILVFTIENSSSGKYVFDNNMLVTSKAGQYAHGYGLKIVKDVINKHNGSINIKPEKEKFTVEIYLKTEDNA